MPFVEVTFEFTGGDRLARIFQAHPALDLSDLREPMAKSADTVLDVNRVTFEREGPGWAPLAPATVEDRERHGFPGEHPILERTGALKRSLTVKGALGNVYEVGRDYMKVGSELETPSGWNLAILHQFGTDRMPARPIIGLDRNHLRRRLSRVWEVWLQHRFTGRARYF